MRMSVLLVDDHPTFRATARLLLESEGYDVIGEAEDGESAVARARELNPQLVLLDVNLPDTDGFEVARAIVAAMADPPAIVLISSREASDFGPRVLSSGALGFIAKDDLCRERIASLL